MRHPLSSSALVAACLLTTLGGGAASADVPWSAFKEGSFVHQRTTVKVGKPGVPDQVSENRTTLVKATRDALVLRSENRAQGGEWRGGDVAYDLTGSAVPEGKPEDLGEEKLTVDGRQLVCAKRRLVARGSTTLSWTHPEHGLVRSESAADGGVVTTQELVRLAVPVKVGAREVACRALKSVSKSPAGTTTSTVWSSPEVPGGVVRMENLTSHAGLEVTATTETLDFQAK